MQAFSLIDKKKKFKDRLKGEFRYNLWELD